MKVCVFWLCYFSTLCFFVWLYVDRDSTFAAVCAVLLLISGPSTSWGDDDKKEDEDK